MTQREIKFRLWDKKAGEYLLNPGLVLMSLSGKQLWTIVGQSLNPADYIRAQFTGLKDSKGVEIFEGDILRFWFVVNAGESSEMLEEVYFGDGAFRLRNIKDPCFVCLLNDWARTCEIIGNVHQNPELLEPNNDST